MRGVRNLGGLAGPGASLKDAGGGGGAASGTMFIYSDAVSVTYGAPAALSLDFSSAPVEAGDILIASGHQLYGRANDPVVTTPGYSILADTGNAGTSQNKLFVSSKVADGSETSIACMLDGLGGLSITVLRGFAAPSALDAHYLYADRNTSGAAWMTHPAMSDRTFDAVLLLTVRRGMDDTVPFTQLETASGAGLLGGRLAPSGAEEMGVHVLSGYAASGGIYTYQDPGVSTPYDAIGFIGLREAV